MYRLQHAFDHRIHVHVCGIDDQRIFRRHQRRHTAVPITVIPFFDFRNETEKVNINPLILQLLILPAGALLRACIEKDFRLCPRENHGAHVLPSATRPAAFA